MQKCVDVRERRTTVPTPHPPPNCRRGFKGPRHRPGPGRGPTRTEQRVVCEGIL